MRLCLYVGPDPWVTTRLQEALVVNRAQLAQQGVLYPIAPGARNHTRALMAVTDDVDALRFHRGHATPEAQARLHKTVASDLAQEVTAAKPHTLILAAHQFGTQLTTSRALRSLKSLLPEQVSQIDIVAHVEAPSHMLARHYALQVFEGRARSLDLERSFLQRATAWWDQALATAPAAQPNAGLFPEVQMAPAFVDLRSWIALWDSVFGAGSVRLQHIDRVALASARADDVLSASFGIDTPLEKIAQSSVPEMPSAEWLARARSFNDLVLRRLRQQDVALPRPLWRKALRSMKVGGPALDPKALAAIDGYLARSLANAPDKHPALRDLFAFGAPQSTWPEEPDFTSGFRASQYLLSNHPHFEPSAENAEDKKTAAPDLSATLPPPAIEAHKKLMGSPYAPHNRLGRINETASISPYLAVEPKTPPEGRTGKVIVGCMKNEAPYILEWIAYHRAIGVDHFLIYTNGCEDGTVEILERLQAMGMLEHRDNTHWKGNSPQQHALNSALTEPVIGNADWIIHIDVDEFINVRCGNGTLDDLIAKLPDATHIAMTWRLFGHNGVARLKDDPVIAQFDRCAPSFCPKPHTAWGFKTMFRNIGAYQKISCHRPNKLVPGREGEVRWVNGSGAPMGEEIKTRGWRNSIASIGYDLVQLNHYALRSAESFLIKRQRGRALHVDRTIGLNYWIRMDWSDARDITIQRNIPRVQAARDQLLQDKALRHWHAQGLAWHRERADALRRIPEFETLYEQALSLRLTQTERAAYALALNMDS